MRTIIINCDPPSVLVPPTPRDVTTSSGDRALFIIINREEPGLCQPLPGHKKSIHNTLISHSHSKMITAGGGKYCRHSSLSPSTSHAAYEIWLESNFVLFWVLTRGKGWRQPGPAGGWVGLYLGTQYTLHGLLLYSSVITRGEFNLTPITGLGHQREQELKLVQKWGWEDATQPGELRPQNEFPRSKKPGSWKSRCRKINFMTSWRIIKHKAWHTRTRIIWYFMSKIKRDYIQCHKTIYSGVPVSCFIYSHLI